MPRPNPGRIAAEEDRLARRIAFERVKQGMSYEGLAKRMTDEGCPTNQSALYKIEKGEPRRRITVAELVALGKVFKLPIEELLVPPEAVVSEYSRKLFGEWTALRREELELVLRQNALEDRVQEHMSAHPEMRPMLEEALARWAHEEGRPDVESFVEVSSLRLRGVPHDSPEYRETLDRLADRAIAAFTDDNDPEEA